MSVARGCCRPEGRAESDEIFEAYTIPGPGRPLFQAGLANFTPKSVASVDTKRQRGPLLLIGGALDRTVPAATVRAAYKIQAKGPGVTELKVFPDRAHSMASDHGWTEIAETALTFLAAKGLGPEA